MNENTLYLERMKEIEYDNLTPTFGAVIHDIDLTDLIYEKSKFLYDLFSEKKLLIFPGQTLDNKQLSSVASIFGKVWQNNLVEMSQEDEILSKKHKSWQIDLTYFPSQVLPNRLLYADELQESGTSTDFLDTIEGIKFLDQHAFSLLRGATIYCKSSDKVMRRPALNWHPKHNSWSLVADEMFTLYIEDNNYPINVPHKDSFDEIQGLTGRNPGILYDNGSNWQEYLEFIRTVIEQMKSPNTLYSHEWKENDLVIYDNWSLMHNNTQNLKSITWDQDWHKFDIDLMFDDMMMIGTGPGGWSHDLS